MPKYAFIQKEIGETPLQALERFRKRDERLSDVPMTYAGRLDPMASGTLLILIGEECKKRADYDGLDKTYEFEVLLGASSDTGDILGLATVSEAQGIAERDVQNALDSLVGAHRLPYPAYSSKTVHGEPLFAHALAGTLDDADLPERDMRIRSIEYGGMREISNVQLVHEIEARLDLLRAPVTQRPGSDFRINEIKERWRETLALPHTFYIVGVRADVSTGTYIRALAPLFANRLNTIGLAYSIRRTAIRLT